MPLSTIDAALEDIRAGRFVIVVDDDDRENEGDLIIAGDHISPEAINFMARYGRGLICCALDQSYFEKFGIPLMVPAGLNTSRYGTSFGISVGARTGITTGISAPDRARTVALLVDPSSPLDAITMPGHIFPLRARSGGVLERRGHTEAAVDLARLAGCNPGGVICEVMKDDGNMARFDDLEVFAEEHQIKIISIDDLATWRRRHEIIVRRINTTSQGTNTLHHYRDCKDVDHYAATFGDQTEQNTSVYLHQECVAGDLLGACDCATKLAVAKETLHEQGGILLYLRPDAEASCGQVASRLCDTGAAMLRDLGVSSVAVITNGDEQIKELRACDVNVTAQIPLDLSLSNS